MAQDNEQLVVDVVARVSDFERNINRAKGTGTQAFSTMRRESATATKAMEDNFVRSTGRIQQVMAQTQGVAANFFRGLAAPITAGGLFAALNKVKTELLAIGELSGYSGMSVGQTAGLRSVATANNVSAEKMSETIKAVADNIAEASREETDFGKLLEANGVKIKDREGRLITTNEVLQQAARLIQNAANESDKIKIADTLGIARELIPIFARGTEHLAQQRAIHDKNNAGLAEAVRKAEEFDKWWNEAWGRFQLDSKTALIDVGRGLGYLAEKAWDFLKGLNELRNYRVTAQGTAGMVWREDPNNPDGGPPATTPRQVYNEPIGPNRPEPAATRTIGNRGPFTIIPGSDRGGRGGGGGGDETDTAKTRLDRYIDSLAREDAVMRSQIATWGQSNAARKAAEEIARASVDLNRLDAATRADVVKRLTDQVNSSEALRTKLEELNKAQAQQKELQDANKEFFGSIFKGAATGKLGIDTLTNALNRLQDRVLTMTFDSLWDSLFPKNGAASGGGLTSVFSQLLASIFGGFRADGGPVAANRAYIVGERGPELFLPKAGGHIVPNAGIAAPRMPNFGGGGGMRPQVSINVTNNSRAQVRTEQDEKGNITFTIDDVVREVSAKQARGISSHQSPVGDSMAATYGLQAKPVVG